MILIECYDVGNAIEITFGCSNSVAFGVEEAADLSEVAVALDDKVQHGRFHQEGEVAVDDAFDALLVVGNEDGRSLPVHVAPHFLISFDARILLP